jgi:hypothetical protein
MALGVWLSGRPEVRAEEWNDRTIGEGDEDKVEGWFVEQERADRVQIALDYIARRQQELGSITIESESQSDPGQFFNRDDWKGTCDITLAAQMFLEVCDYKDGQMWVSEKNNSQMIAYLGGKLLLNCIAPDGSLDLTLVKDWNVRMTIIQPKTSKPIRYQDMTAPELIEKLIELSQAAAKTDDPNAPLIPGDHCTWCSHGRAGNCSAKTQVAMEGLAIMSTPTEEGGNDLLESIQSGKVAPGTMTVEQLSAVMDASPLLRKMLDDVEKEVEKRLKDDTDVPG